jgi:hypothetical protein
MHLYLHIINDTERILDPDGEEFLDLEAARKEGAQVARDLMAQELLHGRPLPFGWRVQIGEPDGTIRHTIKFTDIAGVGSAWADNAVSRPANNFQFHRTPSARRVAKDHAEIHGQLAELWQHLQTLTRLSESIKTG